MTNNKKSFLLLLGLLTYVFSVIFLFNADYSLNIYANVTPKDSSMEVLGRDTAIEWGQVVLQGEAKESEPIALASGKVGRCDQHVTKLPLQLFCSGARPDGFDAWRIYAPAVLFAGAEAPYDNLVQVNNPSGQVAFRNAAEILDHQNDYFINMPPGSEFLDSTILSKENKKKPFEMHFGITARPNIYQERPSKLEFDSLEKSRCPGVVNGGEFNVSGSNWLQEEMTDSVSPPGLMALGSRNYTGMICGAQPRTKEINLSTNESFLLCPRGNINCTCLYCPPPIYTVFLVDAPLGSGEICNTSDCAIRYWEAGRILTNPPLENVLPDEYKLYPDALPDFLKENDYIVEDPVILTTPCRAKIGCQEYYGPCIWDISIWQHVYEIEQIFTYPDYEEKKELEEYWEEVEKELKRRG